MESNKQVALDVTLTSDDFIKYQFYHMRKFYILYFWSVVLILSIVFILLYPPLWIFWVFFSLISAALGNVVLAVFLRRRFIKDFNSDPVTGVNISSGLQMLGLNKKSQVGSLF